MISINWSIPIWALNSAEGVTSNLLICLIKWRTPFCTASLYPSIPYEPPSTRIGDNNAYHQRNHISSPLHINILLSQVKKDTSIGFYFLFHPSLINDMPYLVLSHYSIIFQLVLDKFNNLILKFYSTHNLSLDQLPEKLVKNGLDRDLILEICYKHHLL